MKRLILAFGILLTSIFSFSQSLAPQVIGSAGDYFATTNIKLNWTLGEVEIETFTGGNNILTQGFQQSSYLYTSTEDTPENKEITLYPNPFSDILTVNTGNYSGLSLQIFDLNGKKLLEKKIENSNTQIDFSEYASGLYIVDLNDKNVLLKSFKIQKIKN